MTCGLYAGNYNFTLSGAAGGAASNSVNNRVGFGGLGAKISGTLSLSVGQQVYIVVGQPGDSWTVQQTLGDSGGEGADSIL